MDNRFVTDENGHVTDKLSYPKYADGTPVLISDVVFHTKNKPHIDGPYVVRSIAVTSIGTIINMDPMPNLGPSSGIAVEETTFLIRATEADIRTIEAKQGNQDMASLINKLRESGFHIVRVWATKRTIRNRIETGFELFLIMTGGRPLTSIPLEKLEDLMGPEVTHLDWDDINDLTYAQKQLDQLTARELNMAKRIDARDVLLSDEESVNELSKWLAEERSVPEHVIESFIEHVKYCQAEHEKGIA